MKSKTIQSIVEAYMAGILTPAEYAELLEQASKLDD